MARRNRRRKGYAEVSIDGKTVRVSRVMVRQFVRDLKPGEEAGHATISESELHQPETPRAVGEGSQHVGRKPVAPRTRRLGKLCLELISLLPIRACT